MIPGSPFAGSGFPTGVFNAQEYSSAMAATARTQWLFVADWYHKDIVVYSADPNTGVLMQAQVVATPEVQYPAFMTVSPNGLALYVADANGMQIVAYAIATNGDLTALAGSPYRVSQPVVRLTMDAQGKLLYASGDNEIFGFTVNSDGSLSPSAGNPTVVRAPFVTPGKGPTNIAATLDPKARFLFVADSTQPVTYVYSVGEGGLLTPIAGSPFANGIAAIVATVDPLGQFVYEPEAQVAALAVNQTAGTLTPVPGSPFDNGPFRNGGAPVGDAAMDPTGHFLLLADTENSAITVFSIAGNGALSNVANSPFQVENKPIGGGAPAELAITH